MNEIKQVELWKNWRQFVPHPYKDTICPQPADDIIDRVKEQQSAKHKMMTSRKRAVALEEEPHHNNYESFTRNNQK
jgi:hypothetical protein